jgi:hypothetical protein
MVEKWSQSWRSHPAFSSAAESLQGYVEPKARNLPILKRQEDERCGINRSKSNKAPSQLLRWNPGRRQWKMTTDNSRTQISEPSPSTVEKRNS